MSAWSDLSKTWKRVIMTALFLLTAAPLATVIIMANDTYREHNEMYTSYHERDSLVEAFTGHIEVLYAQHVLDSLRLTEYVDSKHALFSVGKRADGTGKLWYLDRHGRKYELHPDLEYSYLNDTIYYYIVNGEYYYVY